MPTLSADNARRGITEIFRAAGSNTQEADYLADHLVKATLKGAESHGIIRTLRYVGYILEGKVRVNQNVSVTHDGGSILLLDGNLGIGQSVGEQAMRMLAERAKKHGIALCGLSNSGHLGRLGHWAERLAEQNLASIHFLNTTGIGMLVAPFGGSDRRVSPNPIAIAIPHRQGEPVIMDVTSAASAEGKILVAKNAGKQIPEGHIIDNRGQPTTDPNALYEGGSILPIAGHKGSALNIMIDMMAGIISGGGCTAPDEDKVINTMTSIAISMDALGDTEKRSHEIQRFADWVTASPPADPDHPVRMPGENGRATTAERLKNGIPFDDTTYESLFEAADAVGIQRDSLKEILHA